MAELPVVADIVLMTRFNVMEHELVGRCDLAAPPGVQASEDVSLEGIGDNDALLLVHHCAPGIGLIVGPRHSEDVLNPDHA